jgi:hypothetical protein
MGSLADRSAEPLRNFHPGCRRSPKNEFFNTVCAKRTAGAETLSGHCRSRRVCRDRTFPRARPGLERGRQEHAFLDHHPPHASRSGAVRILCHDVEPDGGTALSPLGVVFQQRTRYPDLSIEQNLVCHGALHGIGPPETHAHLVAELARVGLADRIRDRRASLERPDASFREGWPTCAPRSA